MSGLGVDVALVAAPYGFGPLSKALAVADELATRGCKVAVLCHESGHALFSDRPYTAATYRWREPLNLDDLGVPLVISSGDVSTPFRRSTTRLVVLDSLLWLRGMWERPPPTDADLYVAQKFFLDPPPETAAMLGSRLRFVDAILPAWTQHVPTPVNGEREIVIYPGGLFSPVLTSEHVAAYLGWLTAVLRQVEVPQDDVVVRVPAAYLESAASAALRSVARLRAPTPDGAERLLHNAAQVLVAPGIESALEAGALGFTPLFLPPLIGTHLVQLIGFRRAGFGIELTPTYTTGLADLEASTDQLNVLSKHVADRALTMLATLKHLDEAAEHLASFIAAEPGPRAPTFPLGRRGAEQAATLALEVLA